MKGSDTFHNDLTSGLTSTLHKMLQRYFKLQAGRKYLNTKQDDVSILEKNKELTANRRRRQDFPTPESPISSSLNK